MRAVLIATLLIAVAGCSAERKQVETLAAASPSHDAAQAARVTPMSMRTPGQAGFASMPDRGELVARDPARQVRKQGHWTFEPVRISEQHALAAVGGRALVVDTPDGRQLRLQFAEHVDHGDGNWTWIGRDVQGQRALITFGERAVFGAIPDGRDTLQITTDRNGGWLARAASGAGSTRTRLAALTGRVDFLVPPNRSPRDTTRTMATASAPVKAAATSAAAAVVDVVVGYTPGMIADRGNASAVNTRIQFVIAYTNEAYAASGIAHRVRLVHTVQVNFDDNSLNDTALNQLTGDDGNGTSVPIPAQLEPLRSAGVQYGGDIVMLMRKFMRTQQSCGIAWLLGGGGTDIDDAQDYAYGVASDGEEYDPGTGFTHYCEDSTLAHEMGHLMGQTHNVEDTTGTGVHAYSYGYREASSTGFYTIMAYGGDNQFGIPYFSTPLRTYDGRPVGLANQSDNVRSMTETMPIIAAFRASRVNAGVRSDFNGDGRSDILWHNVGSGANVLWYQLQGTSTFVAAGTANPWSLAGIGDVDGDGQGDIVWRNADTGQNVIWRSGRNTTPRSMAAVAVAWKIAAVGDFNGDGQADVWWRHPGTGANQLWRSADSTTRTAVTSTAVQFQLVQAADFNGDGSDDALWRNTATGANVIWRSGNSATPTAVSPVALTWKVAGTGDFDGDGKADILWRNTSTGANQIWRSANANTRLAVVTVANQQWQVGGVGDFDNDGKSDILWRNSASGANQVWRSGNQATLLAVKSVSPAFVAGM